MLENKLDNILNNELGLKYIKIVDMDMVDDYLFIKLSNNQKILTNGKDLYDVSGFNYLDSILEIGDKLCAVMTKENTICVVDLKTMEVLFEDEKAYLISKQDERTIHVIMKIGGGNDKIYDIETKKYLPSPEDYEFEHSLGNNLYVFRKEHNTNTNFYDFQRCVINADGKIVLNNINGWIEQNNNHLIITKKNEICIIKINEDMSLDIKNIKQNGEIIAKPNYHNGNIIIIEKGIIKKYTPDFELINEFVVDELKEVIDYEIISNVLKLCLPYKVDEKQVNKHLFINIETGKLISHLRIDTYSCWNPKTYIGYESISQEVQNFHFYDADFNSIINLSATSYECVDAGNNECIFVTQTINGKNKKKQLLNTENGNIKDIDYDYVHFHHTLSYGYGVNISEHKMDFLDVNFNIIIPGFDYKKFDLNYQYDKFGYFILNDYICINKHFIDDFGQSRWRMIIQKADGKLILDSVQHKCFAIGNFIQILNNEESQFLNTVTGEIGPLSIKAPVNDIGKIDFRMLNTIDNILSINNRTQLELSCEDNKIQKVKKNTSNTKTIK